MALMLDTHALIWYLSDSPTLSSKARARIKNAERDAEEIFASAISLVEIIHLGELGRLPAIAFQKLRDALRIPGGAIVVAPLEAAGAEAVHQVSRQEVPDMPDRIIAATALHLHAELVTRGRKLQAAGIRTLW